MVLSCSHGIEHSQDAIRWHFIRIAWIPVTKKKFDQKTLTLVTINADIRKQFLTESILNKKVRKMRYFALKIDDVYSVGIDRFCFVCSRNKETGLVQTGRDTDQCRYDKTDRMLFIVTAYPEATLKHSFNARVLTQNHKHIYSSHSSLICKYPYFLSISSSDINPPQSVISINVLIFNCANLFSLRFPF